MTQIDENQEAIARIHLAVKEYDSARQKEEEEQINNDGDKAPPPVAEGNHWKLGSDLPRISAEKWEDVKAPKDQTFHHFERRLREFLTAQLLPQEQPCNSLMV